MGILKNFEGDGHDSEQLSAIPSVHEFTTNHLSDTSSEDEEPTSTLPPVPVQSTVPVTSIRTPKVKKPVSKMPKPILHVKNRDGKRSQGNRHAKRHENMCFLLNLATDLDEDFAEVNINDLVETTISAFAQLLLNKNKMKIWNEFVDLPEVQQEHLLKVATRKMGGKRKKIKTTERIQKGGSSNSCSSDDTLETFVIIDNRTTNDKDEIENRSCQLEDGDACFRRIDSNIRYTLKSMLKRRHLPLDRIIWFEDDLIPFFKEYPDSIYLRDLNNGFDRMLLHAVCQYLNLISKSYTRDGERYTQVENRRVTFIPPTMLLSEYVQALGGTMEARS